VKVGISNDTRVAELCAKISLTNSTDLLNLAMAPTKPEYHDALLSSTGMNKSEYLKIYDASNPDSLMSWM